MKHHILKLSFLIITLCCAVATASNAQTFSDLNGKTWVDRATAMQALSNTKDRHVVSLEAPSLSEKEVVLLKIRHYTAQYTIDHLGDDLVSIPEAIWAAYNQVKTEYNAQITVTGISGAEQRNVFDEIVSAIGK